MKSKLLLILLILSPLSYADSLGKALFNTMQYQKAKEELPKLSDAGDSDASFWLALVQFRTGKSHVAGDTMLKAAKQGNPWAMRLMVPEWNGYCDFLGWPCGKEWKAKAIESWKKLAANNDGKAIYALLKWDPQTWQSIPIYRTYKYDELVERAVKNGGYQAIDYNTKFPMSFDKKIELLRYAVEKNDPNSMTTLYLYCRNGKVKETDCGNLLKKSLNLGMVSVSYALYNKFRGYSDEQINFEMIKPELAYYYYYMAERFGLQTRGFNLSFFKFTPEQNTDLKNKISKLDFKKIESEVESDMKNISPNLYYDESFPYDTLLKP